MLAATIVARSQLPEAHVLGASFLSHHPRGTFVVLVLDADDALPASPLAEPGFETLTPTQIGVEAGLWARLRTAWDRLDLAAALRPLLLRHLLAHPAASTTGSVAVLDSQTRIFSSVLEAFKLARDYEAVMVPRLLRPLPVDGQRPDEEDFAAVGAIGDEAVWVGTESDALLSRWVARVASPFWTGRRADCHWLSTIAIGPDIALLREAGWGLSAWNLHERPLSISSAGRFLAAGRLLRTMDLRGLDAARPWRRPAGSPARSSPADSQILATILREHAVDLRVAKAKFRSHGYRWDQDRDGIQLGGTLRRAYRTAWARAALDGAAPPASAFEEEGDRNFSRWLTDPVMGPARLRLGPVERQRWEDRPDLRARFPDVSGRDAEAYRVWLDTDQTARELRPPASLTGPSTTTHAHRGRSSGDPATGFGWNIVGHHGAARLEGEVARRMSASFERAALLTEPVDVPAPEHDLTTAARSCRVFDNSVYCVAPQRLERSILLTNPLPTGERARSERDGATGTGPDQMVRPGGRRIALWLWDLQRFPDPGSAVWDQIDEVWCPSQFTVRAVSAVAPVPVRWAPLPASPATGPTKFRRVDLDLPSGFIFYLSYHLGPVLGASNPLGALTAFARAFPDDEDVALVLASDDGAHHPDRLAEVRYAAGGDSRIHVVDGPMDPDRRRAMLEHSDCFISVHRAEGTGLEMAGAMISGRPVIATAYGANLDFMDARSAHLVPYELTVIGEGNAPFPEAGVWAEPNLEIAARCMRSVFADPPAARMLGRRGAQRVRQTHGLWQSAYTIARLLDIRLPRKVKL